MDDERFAAIIKIVPLMRVMTASHGVRIAMTVAMVLIVELLTEDFEMDEATALRGADAIAKDVAKNIRKRFAAKKGAN